MMHDLKMGHRLNLGAAVAVVVFLGALLKAPLACSEEASPATSLEAGQGQLEADNPDHYYRSGAPVDTYPFRTASAAQRGAPSCASAASAGVKLLNRA